MPTHVKEVVAAFRRLQAPLLAFSNQLENVEAL